MNSIGKIAVCLAGGLVCCSGMSADKVLLPGNPYAPVVVRNIFGLNPPIPVDANATAPEPPVKITPNGIMSIFGELQVLFKVSGKPPGKDTYTLSVGERQDDIEIVKIDENAGIVTFNNHGIVQALALVPGKASSTPDSVPSPGGRPAGNNRPNGFNNRFGNRANFPERNRGGNSGGNNNNGNNGQDNNSNGGYNGSDLRSVPTRTGNTVQDNTMSGEEQMILIAAQHAKLQQEGNPAAVIFPPTPIDADAGITPSPGRSTTP